MNVMMFCSSNNVGLTYHLTSLAIALKQKGVNIIPISSRNEQVPGLFEKLSQKDIKYYRCPYIDKLSIANIIKSSMFLKNIIKDEKIDIIHLQGILNLPAVFLALKLHNNNQKKVPIVLTLHSSLILESKRYRPILILTSKLINSFFTISDFSKEQLCKLGIPLYKIITIHNAIDFSSFDKLFLENKYDTQLEKIIPFNSSDKIIAYVAFLRPAKGHIYILEAAPYILNIFPNTKILLVGGGPLKEKLKLENLASELNISDNVIFTGKVPNYLIPRLLNNIDIGVSPSLREVCPHNVLEYMAAKKPVVATDVGGTAELVKHEVSGFIVPPKDSVSLAKAVCILLDNHEKALEMGIKGRQICEENFDINVIAEKLIKNYEIIIKKGNKK